MKSKYLWLLEPGHGGIVNGAYQTSGKRSPKLDDGRQLFEGVFNRAIAKRVLEKCKANNIDCINLIETEIDLPLELRVDVANDVYRRNLQVNDQHCIYVSIHANAFSTTGKLEFNNVNGWEVFTTYGETKSDKVANIFFEQMKQEFPKHKFRSDYTDKDPDKEVNFYVLRKTVMPAILTENFFMTNKDEVEVLLSEEGKDRIADAHFKAILEVEKIDLFN